MNTSRLIGLRSSLRSVSEKLKSLQEKANEAAFAVTVIRTDLLNASSDEVPATSGSPNLSVTSPSIHDLCDDDDDDAQHQQRSVIRLPTVLGNKLYMYTYIIFVLCYYFLLTYVILLVSKIRTYSIYICMFINYYFIN